MARKSARATAAREPSLEILVSELRHRQEWSRTILAMSTMIMVRGTG
jgi:hypothetical protein